MNVLLFAIFFVRLSLFHIQLFLSCMFCSYFRSIFVVISVSLDKSYKSCAKRKQNNFVHYFIYIFIYNSFFVSAVAVAVVALSFSLFISMPAFSLFNLFHWYFAPCELSICFVSIQRSLLRHFLVLSFILQFHFISQQSNFHSIYSWYIFAPGHRFKCSLESIKSITK